MSGIVTIEVTRGELAHKTFAYAEKARVFIGRQEDCGIVLPESTVSRYHCVLEILPPVVKLQDFGSLNGTYLNGEMIGKRDKNQPWEQAKDEEHTVYLLKDGDVLGLGSRCELRCSIEEVENCAICGVELPKGYLPTNTILEGAAPQHYDAEGRRICRDCDEKAKQLAHEVELEKARQAELELKRQAELLHAQAAAAPAQEPTKKCTSCGRDFVPTAPDNNLCGDCLKDRGKVIDAILGNFHIEAAPPEKAVGSSPLAGYVKIKLLGKGGMGEVWKVRQESTGKLFALKTMLPQVAADSHSRKLFLREAEIGKVLHHKNVIKTYETGNAGGILYVLMDLCEGGSVEGWMEKKGGRLSLEEATRIMLQILSGLDYVHHVDLNVPLQKGLFHGSMEAHGIVHRDFKPGNVFLMRAEDCPTAVIADFGMAKAFDAAGVSRVTKSGAVMGTPVFMPRQQALNTKYAKPEVDIWAASASYYNMLTGTFPKNFRLGVNPWKVIVGESAVPINERDVDIPKKLAAVIDHALCEEPAIGYQSATALRQDLVSALPDDLRAAMKGVL